ncbi:MAG: hypothetical protein KJ017_07135 [Alphaproteobacteria bacterium]|jgi:hypothetical protein|nr:hypothetical protein [Alphaproteobacteria bacterium]
MLKSMFADNAAPLTAQGIGGRFCDAVGPGFSAQPELTLETGMHNTNG